MVIDMNYIIMLMDIDYSNLITKLPKTIWYRIEMNWHSQVHERDDQSRGSDHDWICRGNDSGMLPHQHRCKFT